MVALYLWYRTVMAEIEGLVDREEMKRLAEVTCIPDVHRVMAG